MLVNLFRETPKSTLTKSLDQDRAFSAIIRHEAALLDGRRTVELSANKINSTNRNFAAHVQLTRRIRTTAIALLFSIGSLGFAQATDESNATEQDSPNSHDYIEELVAVGTRHESRSYLDSAVPVDKFTAEDLNSVHSSDMIEVLSSVIPSFSVRRQPISDGSSFVRPTHIRNLEPHHTLVLVNHKRRHKAAVMQVGGWGAHGADIGAVPAIAIRSIEVLRDGAAAQYGSDAIAGVVNFNLRDSIGESMLQARIGQYTAGDGLESTIEGYTGIAIANEGLLTASFQVSDAAPTSRSQHYDISIAGTGILPHEAVDYSLIVDGRTFYGPDAHTYTYAADGSLLQVVRGPDGIPDDLDRRFAENFHTVGGSREFTSPAQIWGQPKRRQFAVLVNFEIPAIGSWHLYGFANFTGKDQTGGFFYRRPGISTMLPIRLPDGSIYDVRQSLYPAGFTPQFSADVEEIAKSLGLRRAISTSWDADISFNGGRSVAAYTLENTLNPSLGPDTPTSFRPGELLNTELALNLDFAGSLPLSSGTLLQLAVGAERRVERYEIKAGDRASFQIGPYGIADPHNFEITQAEVDANPNDALTVIECRIPGFEIIGGLCSEGDPIHNAIPIGSNGFPGFSPSYATDRTRSSAGAYADAELDVTARWLLNGALRAEDFSDFGGIAVWKLASRFAASDTLNIRGSIGTGFRAPSTGQLGSSNVSTRINPAGIPEAVGLFPSTHPASTLFGGTALEPEESFAFTVGTTSQTALLGDLTIDAYRVKITDRLILASGFVVGPAEREQLIKLAVPGALDIGRVSFFTNDVDTITTGLDVTGRYDFESRFGKSSVSWLVNFNRTRISKRGAYVNEEGAFDIENGVPSNRATVTVRHAWRVFDFYARVRWYGTYENAANATLQQIQAFAAETFLDVAATINFTNGMRFKLGVENALDNYPDPGEFETCCGRIYRSDSMVPWQGALVHAQLQLTMP